MEKLSRYRAIARKIILDLGAQKNRPDKPIRYQVVADEETGNYLLVRNGWKGSTRFYNTLVHIEVRSDATVWLHQDNTDLVIADMLLDAGIPPKSIVLGFHTPAMRPDTEFAVG